MLIKRESILFAGVIDSDYRGDVGVILLNTGDESFEVEEGDRILRLFLNEHYSFGEFEEVDELSDIDRGGGFGHTGTK